jgi:hypothetical protein
MAQLAVIVMCLSERAPPVPMRRLVSSGTKCSTTQNWYSVEIDWNRIARPEQRLPPGDWTVWLLVR